MSTSSESGKWLAGFVLATLFIVAVVVWSSARCPQEKLTELRGLIGQGVPQREMQARRAEKELKGEYYRTQEEFEETKEFVHRTMGCVMRMVDAISQWP